ncbi:MAG: bifunctional 2-C-methyl-D-erythritol 4-phosphate cytidylyltransferase/2-C-methyl-D-erythritol 2,4-cyclodiphosphate synthase [Sulfurovum sp.]|nr:bifunctional 2-C-methyl-D-erythritol 4-phosphate cytidylyltransferase/2-C-methyl-D-erythritol 2,4-cyclodiphosphate synthase [Sulfurovum sp.]
MQNITLVLLTAGSSSRFGMNAKKQWLYQAQKPLWLAVADRFQNSFNFARIIIVCARDEIEYMKQFSNYYYVTGGNSRQASLAAAIKHVKTSFVLVSDIARCCADKEMIERVISQKENADCVVPALKATDTLYLDEDPIDREKISIIQTPQLSNTEVLKDALKSGHEFTDESSAIKALGKKVLFVEGSEKAHKLTNKDDLKKLSCLEPPSAETLIGFGIDIHSFEEGKEMKLCGIIIDSPFGFKAHSDGDVAIHALIDALIGAAGMGDIGELFPDTDSAYAGADSILLLQKVIKRIRAFGFELVNIDMTILAQTPRLLPYKKQMKNKLADVLKIRLNRINIKATTAEKMGFVGRKEGITVHAVASLKYFNWNEVI